MLCNMTKGTSNLPEMIWSGLPSFTKRSLSIVKLRSESTICFWDEIFAAHAPPTNAKAIPKHMTGMAERHMPVMAKELARPRTDLGTTETYVYIM